MRHRPSAALSVRNARPLGPRTSDLTRPAPNRPLADRRDAFRRVVHGAQPTVFPTPPRFPAPPPGVVRTQIPRVAPTGIPGDPGDPGVPRPRLDRPALNLSRSACSMTVSRPVGGILSTLQGGWGGHPSQRSTWGWCIRRCAGRAARAPCSTLLRVGFAEPPGSPRALVRSYRTVSPLPVRRPEAPPSAVCSLWHFPAGRPDWPLASTLPCGVPTFLDLRRLGGDPDRHRPRPPGRLTVASHAPTAGEGTRPWRPGWCSRCSRCDRCDRCDRCCPAPARCRPAPVGVADPDSAADPDGAAGLRHGNRAIAAVAAGL